MSDLCDDVVDLIRTTIKALQAEITRLQREIERLRAEAVRLGRCSENIFIATGPPDKVTLDSVSVREVLPDGTLGSELIGEPVTRCKTCKTSWDDCDILADRKCAACLRKEVERLRKFITKHARPCSPRMDGTSDWMMAGYVGRGATVFDAASKAARGENE